MTLSAYDAAALILLWIDSRVKQVVFFVSGNAVLSVALVQSTIFDFKSVVY